MRDPTLSLPWDTKGGIRRERGGMYAVIGLIIGVLLGLFLQPSVPIVLQPYLPIAVVAALDALFGAVRARLEDVFDDRVFVTSFLFNVLIAAFLVFLGDQLGVRSEEHTSELQSRGHLVCRLLLEK